MKLIHYSFLISALLLMASCSAPKKVPYLVDAESIPTEVLSQAQSVSDPVITIGDLLNIQVSGLNMEAVAPFNKGSYLDANGHISRMQTTSNTSSQGTDSSTDYYLVNSDGCIEFPILGKIKAVGMTKNQLAEKIANEIYPKYITEKPVVDIRLMNFRVTIAGAVRSPGIYQSKNERMTFLEAIAMAGDLDIKGNRDNIMLYRVNADGTREVHRIDINDRDFLLSPYYMLQQNDFIYVEPNKSMRQSAWQMNPAVTATLTLIGSTTSLASFVIGIVNLSK